MNRHQLAQYALGILFLVLLYLSYLLIQPFLTYIIFGLILVYLFFPVYKRFSPKLGARWTSILILTFILIIFILPSGFIISKLVSESVNAYNTFNTLSIKEPKFLSHLTGIPNLDTILQQVAGKVKDFMVTGAPSIIGSVTSIALGLFIMFFLMYYAFIDGERWIASIRRSLPLKEGEKTRLFKRIGSITNAVMYGQFLTAVIQGSLGGLLFLIFGIPNPVFWGVIMIILSFIPFLGTPLIWVPAGVIALAKGQYLSGIGVLVLGTLVVMNIDNLLKPYLISSRDKLNPVLVLLGVLGGLKLFGFVGILLGPLVLALLQTVTELFREERATRRARARN